MMINSITDILMSMAINQVEKFKIVLRPLKTDSRDKHSFAIIMSQIYDFLIMTSN